MSLKMTRTDYDRMVDQIRAGYPLESCGLLAGQAGQVQQIYPISNIEQSSYAYRMHAQEQVKAMMEIEASRLELLAIYHSHPHGPATPSPDDVAQAYYPDAIQVIVSLESQERPSARAFRIVNGRVTEVPFQIV